MTERLTIRCCLELLAPLRLDAFPERDLERHWGQRQIPYAALSAAELIRLEQGLHSTGDLHVFLREHPGFKPLLGFNRVLAPNQPLGFNARASLPTPRHFDRRLRRMPNAAARFLLAESVRLILAELAARQVAAPQCIWSCRSRLVLASLPAQVLGPPAHSALSLEDVFRPRGLSAPRRCGGPQHPGRRTRFLHLSGYHGWYFRIRFLGCDPANVGRLL
jgi:hypothetical protein